MEIIGEVLLLKDRTGHSRFGSNLSYKSWIWLKLERVDLNSRNLGWKLFQVNGVAKWVEGVEIPFYSPHREFARWGVKDPDMSGREPDKSGNPLWNPVQTPDKSSAPRLSRWKTAWPDMCSPGVRHVRQSSLESGEPVGEIRFGDLVAGESWLTRHVQSMGRTYPANLSGIRWRSPDKY
jgi:hypothetical protein